MASSCRVKSNSSWFWSARRNKEFGFYEGSGGIMCDRGIIGGRMQQFNDDTVVEDPEVDGIDLDECPEGYEAMELQYYGA